MSSGPRPVLLDHTQEGALTRQGWVIVPFLSDADVVDLTATYWNLGPAPGDGRHACYFDFQSTDRSYKAAVQAQVRPVFAPHVDQLFDHYRPFYANYIMKWPGSNSGFAPHQDITLVDEDRFRSVTIWCPLVDVTAENGACYFVPGSHDAIASLRAHDPGSFAYEGLEDDIIERLGQALPMRAGEALIFDHRAVHFSFPNRGDQPRLVAALGLWPEEADLFHVRRVGETDYDFYEIDERFFLDNDPMSLVEGVQGYTPTLRRTFVRPAVDPSQFSAHVHSRSSVGPTRRRRWRWRKRRDPINQAAFCLRCGEVVPEYADSLNHGNVMTYCASCSAERGSDSASASVPEGWPSF